ncbi:leucine-rich repeats and immunoglobulin-like domains protein 1 isoform X1 [Portunus trituberculatus]|uniref:leucine-rich repeats and immunoglobulin-like domains protein 1 isoform X1 n=1 Tax=Portunus trituberculatus TaxID=210409 RepID=UPI001E1CBF18|nr:leucine-rich repeats and immunoglobulin-like domains protein 1 isoform X1 [Portunus trituberculatus]XP_045128567.1 leucine-rich repeats and immunoglobulin-like domains protein 1 isoform X1 [Portunus trituberculatus]XP_045128568.1 leucine-rich repeats and immunoglobulin-like domains protein 1 isoform X1 [Portunus trituberculatus]XP_045128569.1 leucine-rich repeats and immunoglobulin-like domains protein 1 isoform X1 [Portunus trituberculatus]XP_045128570.1 leucine-rich repeats and immunoglobu
MAGAARRVSGTGLVAGARGRAANHSGSSSNRRRCGVGVGLTVLWVGLMVGLAQGYPQNGVMGVGLPKVIKCPSSMEISPCTCREMKKGKDSGLDIVCDNTDHKHVRNALDILKNKPAEIYWMKFRNCNLPRITDYVFLGLDVRHLNIIRSNVSAIERASLSALGGTLLTLDLANNKIREVPTRALGMLKKLTFLNLNYNPISVLNEGAFDGLVMLERLSLYDNHITHINDNAFKGIGRKLMRLNLGKNKLKYIPTDTFHPLTNLEVLDLHENRISQIPDGAFEGLRKLDMLKLEHNEIKTIQANVFSDLTVLNSLNIEHNLIANISDRAFAGLESNLEWLELGHNALDHIPSHALRPLHNLRQLDLESNNISYVQEDAFKGYGDTVKYILLDKNNIKRIPPLAFMDLHSLEWLKLSYNDLTSLTEDTVQPILDTLTMIDVSHNPLQCSCDLLWLWRWLSNPNNRETMISSNDHICITKDRKSHPIEHLPVQQFDCPRHVPNEMVPPVPQATPHIWPTRPENSTSGYSVGSGTTRSPDGAAVMVCSPILVAAGIASVVLTDNAWH